MNISALAASLVGDRETIMRCASATTQALARRLSHNRLMVVSNSLLVADELIDVPSIEVYVVGGLVRRTSAL